MDLTKLPPPPTVSTPTSPAGSAGSIPGNLCRIPAVQFSSMDHYGQQVRAVQQQQMMAAAEMARYSRYLFPPSQASTAFSVHPGFQLQFPANFPGFGPAPGGGGGGGGFGPFIPGYHRGMLNRYTCIGPYREELPKPNHSYIGLIAKAILSSSEKKMILSDIYQWIQDNYPYFKTRPQGWKNSIRHNLSLNQCFIKAGRSATGKGHYWTVHPANIKDFERGDFARRKAQQRVQRMISMGNPVLDDNDSPDDEDDYGCASLDDEKDAFALSHKRSSLSPVKIPTPPCANSRGPVENYDCKTTTQPRKRTAFDVDSLLAPDAEPEKSAFVKTSETVGKFEDTPCPEPHISRFSRVAPTHPFIQPIDYPQLACFGQAPMDFHFGPDTTREKWNQSFALIKARSYPANRGNP